jgi:predicted Zn-dependent protease
VNDIKDKAGDLATSVLRDPLKVPKAAGELFGYPDFSMEQEYYIGRNIAANVLARLGPDRVLPDSHPLTVYVRKIAAMVAAGAEEKREKDDRPHPLRDYHIFVVDIPEVNAVGMPSGYLAITTGALKAAKSEDEIAAVLSHEVAHVQKGHCVGPIRIARKEAQISESALSGTSSVVHQLFTKVGKEVTDFALDKGFGNENELEADAWGARYLDAAAYDVQALSAFISRLPDAGGFAKRHPRPVERVAALAKVTASLGKHDPAPRVARFGKELGKAGAGSN